MQTKICRYCGGEFRANNAKIIYCSPSCRINFNAGKTFGAKQSQQTQLQPQQPVAPLPADHVTREEFQALSAQLGQVLALLQK